MKLTRHFWVLSLLLPLSALAQESPLPEYFERLAPVLAKPLVQGSEKTCVPTHLTVSAPERNGKRFYVSGPIQQFPALVRRATTGTQKLTVAQGKAVNRLHAIALQAQRTGVGFPDAAAYRLAQDSGLTVEAQMLCMSVEKLKN